LRTTESWYRCYICWYRHYYQFVVIVLCCRYQCFEIMMHICCIFVDMNASLLISVFGILLQYLFKDIVCVNADIDWRLLRYHCSVAYATSRGMRVFLHYLFYHFIRRRLRIPSRAKDRGNQKLGTLMLNEIEKSLLHLSYCWLLHHFGQSNWYEIYLDDRTWFFRIF